MKTAKIIFILAFISFFISSCKQIKKKGSEVLKNTKKVTIEKKDAIVNKLFPHFDDSISDTKSNKQRFLEFFKFYPTADINELYCYNDEIGIDASYWFAFRCNESRVEKIISVLKLKPEKKYQVTKDINGRVVDSMLVFNNGLSGGLNTHPAFWWDTSFVNKSAPYARQDGILFWYLWYNKKEGKVHFLTFDT